MNGALDEPGLDAGAPAEERMLEGCWRTIGVSGNRSCPELTRLVHCRNCPVFTAAGRQLLERPAPDGYVAGWTRFLAGAKLRQAERSVAVLVFRLGSEWLCLDAKDAVEVAELRAVRSVPHRPGPVFMGIVNLRGQLQLCVSLHGLLRVEPRRDEVSARRRLVVIQRDTAVWAFPADEIEGLQRFAPTELGPVPVTVASQLSNLARGVLSHGDRRIGYLDSGALFDALQKAVG